MVFQPRLLPGAASRAHIPVPVQRKGPLANIQAGKFVTLAVGSAQRSEILPNVPTTQEAGVKDSAYNFWVGMLAPSRTPRDIITKLN